MEKINIAFFGTPDFTTRFLDKLEKCNLTPILIVTKEDTPKGRKMIVTPPLPKIWGLERNIQVIQPTKIDDKFISDFKKLKIDIGVVVAYGKILPEELLNIPTFGFINIHYSLLPKYRGATPVEASILNGDDKTGISIQKMAYKLDSGDIIYLKETDIFPDETALNLRERLNDLALEILPETITSIVSGKSKPSKQDENQATFTKKIKKEDGLISFTDDPTINYRKYRAYFGWPGTFFYAQKDDKKIRVVVKNASMKDGKFEIEKVIPEGKKEISFSEFLKSYRI